MVTSKNNSDRMFKNVVTLAVVLVVTVAAGWYWSMHRSRSVATVSSPQTAPVQLPSETVANQPDAAAPAPPAVQETPKQPDAVVHYDITDDDFKTLMSRRKARFGLKDSVDMIVESGETVEVGGISVPMEEILDKIRLKTGAIMETDLGPTLSTVSEGERVDRLFTQLKDKEKRFRELAVDLANAPADAPDTSEKLREFESLREVIADYQEYRRTLSVIRDWELVLESPDLREKLTSEADLLPRQKQNMEQDLAVRLGTVADPAAMETHLLKILADYRVRMDEIDDALRASAAHTAAAADLIRERSAIAERITALEKYEGVLARRQKITTLLTRPENEATAEIKAEIKALRLRADELEDSLTDRLLPGERINAYGIYIVRPSDNIWNIHFQFLRENFKHRGITLSARDDEPNERGASSGVGKILKFAEGMVYIYNLREHRLAEDINIIHPMSKIIVFNMAKAIELIKQISYEDIKHIQFDGETLWLPSS